MPQADPLEAARTPKQTAALLREAVGVLRKLDKLVASFANEDPPLPHLAIEARDALERVVSHLDIVRGGQIQHQSAASRAALSEPRPPVAA